MQASSTPRFLKILLLCVMFQAGCFQDKQESAAAAIEKSRGTLIDQVNAVGEGAPFYSIQTLNPIWSAESETPIVRIPKLDLTDQHGKSRSETLFYGKISVAVFMFTSCNGFCPFVMKRLAKVAESLKDRSDIQYVAITVDPEVDTPERLAAYAKSQGLESIKPLILLTGSEKEIYSLARDTLASQVFRKPGAGPRDFVHAGHFYVFDSQGRLRGILNGTEVDAPLAMAKLLVKL